MANRPPPQSSQQSGHRQIRDPYYQWNPQGIHRIDQNTAPEHQQIPHHKLQQIQLLQLIPLLKLRLILQQIQLLQPTPHHKLLLIRQQIL